jgi:thioredoxin reductase
MQLSGMEKQPQFDVIIIGGSYAGLSAAMSLGRSLRKVLIIDGGKPCNRQTPHSHNFITQDGEKPAVIAKKALDQVLLYKTVEIVYDNATSAERSSLGFNIRTDSGSFYACKKLILATGVKDIMPDIPGIAECWGISVVHCPYCHGYEIRNKRTAIMANGERAFHLAGLVKNLTSEIVVLTNGAPDFSDEQIQKLKNNNISIHTGQIISIYHVDGQIERVNFEDGSFLSIEAMYASVPFIQHTEIPQNLGCELTKEGLIMVNPFQQTSVQGIYACGDNCSEMRSVANAVYGGNLAGAMVNRELVEELF